MARPVCHIAQRLAPGAEDGCLPPRLGAWALRHVRGCPRCGEAVRAFGALRGALGALETPSLTPAETEALWRRIHADIAARPAGAWHPLAPLRRARGLAVRRPAAAWAAGAAVAAIALAVFVRFPESRRTLQASLDALTVIQNVEAGSNTSVFVLQTPREKLQVIWVVEPPTPSPSVKSRKEGSKLWQPVPVRAKYALSSSPFPFS